MEERDATRFEIKRWKLATHFETKGGGRAPQLLGRETRHVLRQQEEDAGTF